MGGAAIRDAASSLAYGASGKVKPVFGRHVVSDTKANASHITFKRVLNAAWAQQHAKDHQSTLDSLETGTTMFHRRMEDEAARRYLQSFYYETRNRDSPPGLGVGNEPTGDVTHLAASMQKQERIAQRMHKIDRFVAEAVEAADQETQEAAEEARQERASKRGTGQRTTVPIDEFERESATDRQSRVLFKGSAMHSPASAGVPDAALLARMSRTAATEDHEALSRVGRGGYARTGAKRASDAEAEEYVGEASDGASSPRRDGAASMSWKDGEVEMEAISSKVAAAAASGDVVDPSTVRPASRPQALKPPSAYIPANRNKVPHAESTNPAAFLSVGRADDRAWVRRRDKSERLRHLRPEDAAESVHSRAMRHIDESARHVVPRGQEGGADAVGGVQRGGGAQAGGRKRRSVVAVDEAAGDVGVAEEGADGEALSGGVGGVAATRSTAAVAFASEGERVVVLPNDARVVVPVGPRHAVDVDDEGRISYKGSSEPLLWADEPDLDTLLAVGRAAGNFLHPGSRILLRRVEEWREEALSSAAVALPHRAGDIARCGMRGAPRFSDIVDLRPPADIFYERGRGGIADDAPVMQYRRALGMGKGGTGSFSVHHVDPNRAALAMIQKDVEVSPAAILRTLPRTVGKLGLGSRVLNLPRYHVGLKQLAQQEHPNVTSGKVAAATHLAGGEEAAVSGYGQRSGVRGLLSQMAAQEESVTGWGNEKGAHPFESFLKVDRNADDATKRLSDAVARHLDRRLTSNKGQIQRVAVPPRFNAPSSGEAAGAREGSRASAAHRTPAELAAAADAAEHATSATVTAFDRVAAHASPEAMPSGGGGGSAAGAGVGGGAAPHPPSSSTPVEDFDEEFFDPHLVRIESSAASAPSLSHVPTTASCGQGTHSTSADVPPSTSSSTTTGAYGRHLGASAPTSTIARQPPSPTSSSSASNASPSSSAATARLAYELDEIAKQIGRPFRPYEPSLVYAGAPNPIPARMRGADPKVEAAELRRTVERSEAERLVAEGEGIESAFSRRHALAAAQQTLSNADGAPSGDQAGASKASSKLAEEVGGVDGRCAFDPLFLLLKDETPEEKAARLGPDGRGPPPVGRMSAPFRLQFSSPGNDKVHRGLESGLWQTCLIHNRGMQEQMPKRLGRNYMRRMRPLSDMAHFPDMWESTKHFYDGRQKMMLAEHRGSGDDNLTASLRNARPDELAKVDKILFEEACAMMAYRDDGDAQMVEFEDWFPTVGKEDLKNILKYVSIPQQVSEPGDAKSQQAQEDSYKPHGASHKRTSAAHDAPSSSDVGGRSLIHFASPSFHVPPNFLPTPPRERPLDIPASAAHHRKRMLQHRERIEESRMIKNKRRAGVEL